MTEMTEMTAKKRDKKTDERARKNERRSNERKRSGMGETERGGAG
jgi:hypothetical protein